MKIRSSMFQLIGIGLLFGVLSFPVQASMSMEKQRSLFIDAENALKNNHIRKFSRLSKKLSDYPLYGYLQYNYLRKRLRRVSESRISDFIERYEDSPISARMRRNWLRNLARAGQWKKFISYYRDRDGTKLRCYYARALYETSQIKKANEVTEALWMVGKSQPSACDSVFKIWEKKGGMTRARLWERVRLAMDKGQVSLAKFLASKMNKIDRNWVYHWRKMRKHPAENLLRKIYQVDAPIPNMIVRYGIKRLARRDIGAAADLWETIKTRHYKDTPQEAADVDQFLALRAAYQNHPRALEWLEKIPEPTAKVREWRIRAALSQQDWWAALHWIEALPEAERKSDQWQYWRARILALESKSLPTLRATSEKVYSRLSKERSYHGFMAADRSGGEYALHSDPLTFSKQELSAIENLPGIVRARELFFLGKLVDGRREWSKVTAPLNPIDLQKASLLASRWGWHDRAIFTVARASHFGDLELRFPMAHKEIVLSQAKKQGVEASWVYGVLRQESGFMADARSGAGALGLMQLMPGTSRLTARKLKFRIRSNMELLNVKKNIRLGVAYLRRMWDENEKNNILATASYNAGPYRIKKWLPKQDMPSDLWVETIPFEETRKYVQRVMAYTVIYDKKLTGKTGMMPYRMPLIKAKHDQES